MIRKWGSKDRSTNALFKKGEEEAEEKSQIYLTLIFVPTRELLNQVKEQYDNDVVIKQILAKVACKEANPEYTMREGCQYYKDRLYVPNNQALKL